MHSLAFGTQLDFHVAVATETWAKVCGLCYDGPGEMIFLQQALSTVSFFFLPHYHNQGHRELLVPGFPQTQIRLYHRGTTGFHVGCPQTRDQIILFLITIVFQIVGHYRVQMANEGDPGICIRWNHDQVVAAVIHFLADDR